MSEYEFRSAAPEAAPDDWEDVGEPGLEIRILLDRFVTVTTERHTGDLGQWRKKSARDEQIQVEWLEAENAALRRKLDKVRKALRGPDEDL